MSFTPPPYPANLNIPDQLDEAVVWHFFRAVFGIRQKTVADLLQDDQWKWQMCSDVTFIQRLVNQLPDRQRSIIILRFGLDGQQGRTLEVVKDDFGITRERVRQLEAKSISQMRYADRMLIAAHYDARMQDWIVQRNKYMTGQP